MSNITNATSGGFTPIVAADITYGLILCLVCFLVGIPANVFSLYCFLLQRRTVSSFIYTCITAVDCLICLTALPVGITYLAQRDNLIFGNIVFCNVWAVTNRLLSSLSIFYVLVLSISRTWALLRPFTRLKIRLVKVVVGSHLLLQIAVGTVPYWEPGTTYIYIPALADCEIPDPPTGTYEDFYNTLSRITYSAPIFPILVSCIISVYCIMRDTRQMDDVRRHKKRYASVTIVMFTLISAALNIPSVTISILELTPLITASFDTHGYFLNCVYYLFIPINSTLNPLLYALRMETLRDAMINQMRRTSGSEAFGMFSGRRASKKMCHTVRYRISTGQVCNVNNNMCHSPRMRVQGVCPIIREEEVIHANGAGDTSTPTECNVTNSSIDDTSPS